MDEYKKKCDYKDILRIHGVEQLTTEKRFLLVWQSYQLRTFVYCVVYKVVRCGLSSLPIGKRHTSCRDGILRLKRKRIAKDHWQTSGVTSKCGMTRFETRMYMKFSGRQFLNNKSINILFFYILFAACLQISPLSYLFQILFFHSIIFM